MTFNTQTTPNKKSNFSVSNTIGNTDRHAFFSAKNRKIYENSNTISVQ